LHHTLAIIFAKLQAREQFLPSRIGKTQGHGGRQGMLSDLGLLEHLIKRLYYANRSTSCMYYPDKNTHGNSSCHQTSNAGARQRQRQRVQHLQPHRRVRQRGRQDGRVRRRGLDVEGKGRRWEIQVNTQPSLHKQREEEEEELLLFMRTTTS